MPEHVGPTTEYDPSTYDPGDPGSRLERWWAELTPEGREALDPGSRELVLSALSEYRDRREQRPARVRALRSRNRRTVLIGAAAIVALWLFCWALTLGAPDRALRFGLVGGMACLFIGVLTVLDLRWRKQAIRSLTRRGEYRLLEQMSFAERVEHYRVTLKGLGDTEPPDWLARCWLEPIERQPDGAALPLIEYLAESAPEPALRERAARLLPTIRDLAERQQAGQTLLRPADAQPEVLLRPSAADEAALLRPAGVGASDAARMRQCSDGS